jgi:hypothetical protein
MSSEGPLSGSYTTPGARSEGFTFTTSLPLKNPIHSIFGVNFSI